MSDDLPEYARRLQRLQDLSRRTQAENARRAGMERDAYGRYLHGKTRPPAAKLAALALVFEVKPGDIDPEQADVLIEEAELPPPFEMTEARLEEPGYYRVRVDADLPTGIAQRVAELVAAHAARFR